MLLAMGFTACGGSDDGIAAVADDQTPPTPPTPQVYLTVNGTSSAEHVFPGVFEGGKAGLDYKQVFKINSNVVWNLSGSVDWLNISPTSASGDNINLDVYPTSENNTDNDRKAVLTLKASDVSISIVITQRAGKSVCYVRPQNEVALHNCIGFEYYATPNVNTFQYLLLSESEYKRMTAKELQEELYKQEPMKVVDDYISFLVKDSHNNTIVGNSTYYFVSLASDREGKEGALETMPIKTPVYIADVNNDAWVSFPNISIGTSGFQFTTKKRGVCDSYHIIYGLDNEYSNPALFAFEINYYLKQNKKHWYAEMLDWKIIKNYPNDDTFTYTSSSSYMSVFNICIAYGWGIFKDGTLSSDLIGFQEDSSSNSSSSRIRSVKNSEGPKNVLIKRSEVEKKLSSI